MGRPIGEPGRSSPEIIFLSEFDMEEPEGYSRPHLGNGILVLGLGSVSLAIARHRSKIHPHTSTSREKKTIF